MNFTIHGAGTETVQSDHHYAVYLPVDQPLIDDVPKILTHLQALDTAAQQIATLFGNPNQSLSVQSYAAMIRASENQRENSSGIS